MIENYIELGFCSRPHGIKGAFSFTLINGKDSVLKKGMEILLKPANDKSSIVVNGEAFKIKKIQFGNKVIVELDTILDRNSVEAMIPFSVWLSRESFPKISADEIYLSDLVGLSVVDEKNVTLGIVSGFGSNGVQDILTVEANSGEVFEVLFIDHFIKEIDIEGGVISILLPVLI